jgi:hypothetical protein
VYLPPVFFLRLTVHCNPCCPLRIDSSSCVVALAHPIMCDACGVLATLRTSFGGAGAASCNDDKTEAVSDPHDYNLYKQNDFFFH